MVYWVIANVSACILVTLKGDTFEGFLVKAVRVSEDSGEPVGQLDNLYLKDSGRVTNTCKDNKVGLLADSLTDTMTGIQTSAIASSAHTVCHIR